MGTNYIIEVIINIRFVIMPKFKEGLINKLAFQIINDSILNSNNGLKKNISQRAGTLDANNAFNKSCSFIDREGVGVKQDLGVTIDDLINKSNMQPSESAESKDLMN
jgi:hypothetical protein